MSLALEALPSERFKKQKGCLFFDFRQRECLRRRSWSPESGDWPIEFNADSVIRHFRITAADTFFTDNELEPEATVKQYLIVQTEGSREVRREVEHYNLQPIIAVGFKIVRCSHKVKERLSKSVSEKISPSLLHLKRNCLSR
ncbi:MAG: virulence RhuM family protein [Chlorobium sp.]|nr:MAG: virulence RhuM family protein [Chlorobium sp.]